MYDAWSNRHASLPCAAAHCVDRQGSDSAYSRKAVACRLILTVLADDIGLYIQNNYTLAVTNVS